MGDTYFHECVPWIFSETVSSWWWFALVFTSPLLFHLATVPVTLLTWPLSWGGHQLPCNRTLMTFLWGHGGPLFSPYTLCYRLQWPEPGSGSLLWGISLFVAVTEQATIHVGVSHSAISGFPGGSDGKEFACNAGAAGLIPELGRSPREGNGNPLQYSCLEKSMDRGTWWAMVHGSAKSRTRLSD